MGSDTYDLILCGGGVVGLSIALECAEHGWRVLVIDRQQIGKASSWAGAGILPAGATIAALDPIEQLRALSHRLHREWADKLRQLTGLDNEYRACGGIYLARTSGERATLAANRMWWDDHGITYQAWSKSEVCERVPMLQELLHRESNVDTWFLPDDCRVRNPRHIQALVAACERLGVAFLEQTDIQTLEFSGGTITGAVTRDRVLHAERYCITSGAWASQLLESVGLECGVLPVRGQMVLYRCESMPFPMVINDGHRYLVPRDDGHVLAGSCEEEVGFDCRTTDEMIGQISEWAESICPFLVGKQVSRWAGLRPGSFDSYPYLGALPSIENGWIAAGHFRHGLHWSTGTARLMYQCMNNEPTEIDIEPFRLQRGRTNSGLLT